MTEKIAFRMRFGLYAGIEQYVTAGSPLIIFAINLLIINHLQSYLLFYTHMQTGADSINIYGIIVAY